MVDEIEREADQEHERMKYTVLAGNIQLWKELFGNEVDEGEVPDEEVEWITPSSVEEMEQIKNILSGIHSDESITSSDDN